MRKATLNNTKLTISALCMGTVYFGSRMDDAASFAMLDHFAALGGNFLDTARVYADWLPLAQRQASEKCIGRWLKARKLQDQIIVATKGGHPPLFLPGRPTLSAKDLAHQAEESRSNLGLDTLPLYYLHRDDIKLPVEQIMDGLFALQDKGIILHVACSNWTAERIRQANAYAAQCGREGFVAVSNQWSLARHVPGAGDRTLVRTDDSLCAFHRESGLPLLPFTSMAQGYLSKLAEGKAIAKGLTDSYGLPENDAIARRAKELAAQKGITVAQIAQCFFYGQGFQVIPVMSFSSFTQMEEAAAATEMTITPEECAWLTNG